jgi:hypothetical protein
MGNLRGAKFTHFLAECVKSVHAFVTTFRGRACDLSLSYLRLLYTKRYDITCGFSNVLRTFKLSGPQKLSCRVYNIFVRL